MYGERITRRTFLAHTGCAAAAVAGASAISTFPAHGAPSVVRPNERITMGLIGAGPRGNGVLRGFLGHPQAQVVAVCDVNRLRREETQHRVDDHYKAKGCAAYNDFRDLLARDDIDAVIIASPDHWHVPHAVYAARAGKDMYVEKPLMLSLSQGQVLRDAVHRYGRIFQYGTQQRSAHEFRFACELVRNQRIGELKVIRVGAPASRKSETIAPSPVPDWLDYDLWLGPAPWAPFSEKRVINEYWWHNSDYALGFVAGWGIHHVDIAQWGNGSDLTGPVEISGTGEFPAEGFCDCATKWNITMRYANGVTLEYTDNTQNAQGIRFEGTEGWVYCRRGFIDAEPKELLRTAWGPDDVHLYDSRDHAGNLLDCIRTRRETTCPVDVAVRSDMICHLSDIAMRLKRPLKWDPARERFGGDDEANRMLVRAMRAPWQV